MLRSQTDRRKRWRAFKTSLRRYRPFWTTIADLQLTAVISGLFSFQDITASDAVTLQGILWVAGAANFMQQLHFVSHTRPAYPSHTENVRGEASYWHRRAFIQDPARFNNPPDKNRIDYFLYGKKPNKNSQSFKQISAGAA